MKLQTKAMSYERIPFKGSPFIRKRPITRQTNDLTKLSTGTVLWRLYRRHELLLLEAMLVVTWAIIILKHTQR